ncbi:Acylpyruvase FAHD1, mitochondrial [Paramuricea clavata]|uniref:Oxaloacetate tautomerase FAHD1, mitochondrial n=1 Tax=Paramuricea clavata TaxID=317549 RepID=A0A6S7I9K7_PARCT|nr:Acylpyruvase FAHD1, mitochondrial [Paramuricea clavata]
MAAKMSGRDLKKFAEFGRKIVGVGRNYRDHAKELGNSVPDTPLLFLKPSTAYIHEGQKIKIPSGCSDLHHEVELGVVIGQNGTNIEQNQAMDHVAGYVLALDMTARDFQRDASKKGQPWLLAKGFDTSCPISDFIPKEKLPNPDNVRLWLKTDGAMKQDGNTKDMIFKIPYLISYISNIVTLEEGDLILTGTPAGVSTVTAGQQITAGLNEIVEMSFSVSN